MIALLSATAEPSFFDKLRTTLYELFLENGTYYVHLDLGAQDYKVLMIGVIAFCIGILLASIGIVFNKRVLGGVVRACLQKEALSPERAMTLGELGFDKHPILRHAVRTNVSLRRVIRCREEEEFFAQMEQTRAEYDKKREENPKMKKFREQSYRGTPEDHYYIPEEMKYMADAKFEAKGTSWGGVVILFVLVIVILVLIAMFMPKILELLDDFVGSFGGNRL